jgi:hypothetical protein
MDVRKIVNDYPTKYSYGFTDEELNSLLKSNDLDIQEVYNNMGVNTCMVIDEQVITYHTDIIRGIQLTITKK